MKITIPITLTVILLSVSQPAEAQSSRTTPWDGTYSIQYSHWFPMLDEVEGSRDLREMQLRVSSEESEDGAIAMIAEVNNLRVAGQALPSASPDSVPFRWRMEFGDDGTMKRVTAPEPQLPEEAPAMSETPSEWAKAVYNLMFCLPVMVPEELKVGGFVDVSFPKEETLEDPLFKHWDKYFFTEFPMIVLEQPREGLWRIVGTAKSSINNYWLYDMCVDDSGKIQQLKLCLSNSSSIWSSSRAAFVSRISLQRLSETE